MECRIDYNPRFDKELATVVVARRLSPLTRVAIMMMMMMMRTGVICYKSAFTIYVKLNRGSSLGQIDH